LMLYPMQVKHR